MEIKFKEFHESALFISRYAQKNGEWEDVDSKTPSFVFTVDENRYRVDFLYDDGQLSFKFAEKISEDQYEYVDLSMNLPNPGLVYESVLYSISYIIEEGFGWYVTSLSFESKALHEFYEYIKSSQKGGSFLSLCNLEYSEIIEDIEGRKLYRRGQVANYNALIHYLTSSILTQSAKAHYDEDNMRVTYTFVGSSPAHDLGVNKIHIDIRIINRKSGTASVLFDKGKASHTIEAFREFLTPVFMGLYDSIERVSGFRLDFVPSPKTHRSINSELKKIW